MLAGIPKFEYLSLKTLCTTKPIFVPKNLRRPGINDLRFDQKR